MNGTNNGVTASGFGIEEGFRFYVSGKGHKGWYVEPELWFASVDASNSRVSATANSIGGAVVAWWIENGPEKKDKDEKREK